MAQLVTRPVEEALRQVAGVQDIRSGSSRGSAQISIDFGWGRDMTAATLQVNATLAQVMPSLPAGTTASARRMEPTVFPIIAYGLTSERLSIPQLRDLVRFQVIPLLTTIPGVSGVVLDGGGQEARWTYQIDPTSMNEVFVPALHAGVPPLLKRSK
jgi:multidrug efflux pump subunit AcrB